MTRVRVAIEGKPTIDGRLLLPLSLSSTNDPIPVTMNFETPDKIGEIVGKATDFERNKETGEISYDIILRQQGEFPDGVNAYIALSHVVCANVRNDGVMVIDSAIIRSVHLSKE